MTLLIAGLLLWSVSHLFKRIAPAARARLGDPGKGLVALASVAAIVLMVIGYRGADFVPVYTPLPGMGHANNLLMLVAIFLIGVGHSKGWLGQKLRHPMLLGTALWAVAHLLVNGDLASILLFGGFFVWAVVSMIMINLQDGPWAPSGVVRPRGDLVNLVITLVLYGVIAGIHIWLGHNPFLGSYF